MSDFALKPLPIRVGPIQLARLQHARSIDSMSIQEHIRRAIDDYLDKLDEKYEWTYGEKVERIEHIERIEPKPGQRKARAVVAVLPPPPAPVRRAPKPKVVRK